MITLSLNQYYGFIGGITHNGWLDEAYGDLTNQTFQNSAEPNLLFVFIFSLLKPNQRFGGVQISHSTSKNHKRHMLYTSVLGAVISNSSHAYNRPNLYLSVLLLNIQNPFLVCTYYPVNTLNL